MRRMYDPIKKGKEIVKNSKGVWVHKHCSDVEENYHNSSS